jgi:hypothetical protein
LPPSKPLALKGSGLGVEETLLACVEAGVDCLVPPHPLATSTTHAITDPTRTAATCLDLCTQIPPRLIEADVAQGCVVVSTDATIEPGSK